MRMKTSHTHKSVVYMTANGKAHEMLTVFHRSLAEAVSCVASKKYIDRHNTAHGMYADSLTRTVEGA